MSSYKAQGQDIQKPKQNQLNSYRNKKLRFCDEERRWFLMQRHLHFTLFNIVQGKIFVLQNHLGMITLLKLFFYNENEIRSRNY